MFHCRLVLNGAPPVGFLLISCQPGFACNPRLHSASSCFSSSQTACRPFWRQGGMPGCLKYKVSQAFSSSRHLLYDNKIFLTFSPPRVSRSWWPSNRGCWGLVQQRPTAPQIDSSASPGERTLCMYAEQRGWGQEVHTTLSHFRYLAWFRAWCVMYSCRWLVASELHALHSYPLTNSQVVTTCSSSRRRNRDYTTSDRETEWLLGALCSVQHQR